MNSFIQRYRENECESVWHELLALGNRIQSKATLPDAMAVAEEFVTRTIHNFNVIKSFLIELGYEFQDPHATIEPSSDETLAGVAEIERTLGALPLVMKAWWRQIHRVDFSQSDSQIQSGVGPQNEGLVPAIPHIVSPRDALELSTTLLTDIRAHNESLRIAISKNPERSDLVQFNNVDEGFLPLGHYASNCEPKGFSLPCRGIDAFYFNDGGGDTTFASDLRTVFAAGGFAFMYFGPPIIKTQHERREEVCAKIVPRLIPV